MDIRTKHAVGHFGEWLTELMQERGFSMEHVAKVAGLRVVDVDAVLSRNDVNYSIDTFIRVLSVLDVHLEMHDKHERSNLDILPPEERPSSN